MNKFTNEELALVAWSTVYPNRKPYKDISKEARQEWEQFMGVARDLISLEDCPEIVNYLKTIINEKLL